MSFSLNYFDLIKQIVDQVLNQGVQSIQPIRGKGIVNQVFAVKTDVTEIIIRMNDSPATLEVYEKERWCIEQSTIKGIPGPDVLAVDQMDEVTYMIQTLVMGKIGEESHLNKEKIWHTLGEYTKQIHTIPVNGFGDILSDPTRRAFISPTHEGFDGSWHSFIRYNIESLTKNDPLIQLGVLSYEETKKVRQKFESLFHIHFQFGLTHGDLSLKNTIVDDNGKVTLLDWGCAGVQLTPYWDVIQLIKSQLEMDRPNKSEIEAFLQGYGISKNKFQYLQPTIDVLLLLEAFDKLRWAIDCKPDSISSFISYAKRIWQRNICD